MTDRAFGIRYEDEKVPKYRVTIRRSRKRASDYPCDTGEFPEQRRVYNRVGYKRTA